MPIFKFGISQIQVRSDPTCLIESNSSISFKQKVFENGDEEMFGLHGLEYNDKKRFDCLCL